MFDPKQTQDRSAALVIARGIRRHLAELGYGTLGEFTLPNGRRADVIGIDAAGTVVVVEIKTSLSDLRADQKWPEYQPFCDRFYFAVPQGFPLEEIPQASGLILADAYGAAVVREAATVALVAARRKSILLRFAVAAADRLLLHEDPAED